MPAFVKHLLVQARFLVETELVHKFTKKEKTGVIRMENCVSGGGGTPRLDGQESQEERLGWGISLYSKQKGAGVGGQPGAAGKPLWLELRDLACRECGTEGKQVISRRVLRGFIPQHNREPGEL